MVQYVTVSVFLPFTQAFSLPLPTPFQLYSFQRGTLPGCNKWRFDSAYVKLSSGFDLCCAPVCNVMLYLGTVMHALATGIARKRFASFISASECLWSWNSKCSILCCSTAGGTRRCKAAGKLRLNDAVSLSCVVYPWSCSNLVCWPSLPVNTKASVVIEADIITYHLAWRMESERPEHQVWWGFFHTFLHPWSLYFHPSMYKTTCCITDVQDYC